MLLHGARLMQITSVCYIDAVPIHVVIVLQSCYKCQTASYQDIAGKVKFLISV